MRRPRVERSRLADFRRRRIVVIKIKPGRKKRRKAFDRMQSDTCNHMHAGASIKIGKSVRARGWQASERVGCGSTVRSTPFPTRFGVFVRAQSSFVVRRRCLMNGLYFTRMSGYYFYYLVLCQRDNGQIEMCVSGNLRTAHTHHTTHTSRQVRSWWAFGWCVFECVCMWCVQAEGDNRSVDRLAEFCAVKVRPG